jgi:hypothetical protein
VVFARDAFGKISATKLTANWLMESQSSMANIWDGRVGNAEVIISWRYITIALFIPPDRADFVHLANFNQNDCQGEAWRLG